MRRLSVMPVSNRSVCIDFDAFPRPASTLPSLTFSFVDVNLGCIKTYGFSDRATVVGFRNDRCYLAVVSRTS